ncbi:hypothetical protein GE061_006270 [Apolygus lucorum]|uniref:Uncharacterized protein n=1 Tax=Apolygus lucorum TaxID=248454 RepID=A0A6A4J1M0_APOLU|nr:hypothetical protein GE061_006270 [Apolygus lucorum]
MSEVNEGVDRPFSPDELDDVNHRVNMISRKRPRRKRKLINPRATKICTSTCRYNLVRSTARKYGMMDVPEWQEWHVYWTDVFPSLERCRCMKRYQRINHFPGMLEICRKDTLARNLHYMLKQFPKDYNFFPRTWCLPEDYVDMLEFSKSNPGKTYILKPCRGSEGRGISITKNPKHFRTKYNMIGQVYISKPLLIGGFKFDFRLYTLVTSCDPLRIYVYNEGLARFATKKYEPNRFNLNQRFMHLTNYSVNRRSEDFIIDDDEGSKRELSSINEWFVKQGYDVHAIWDSIDDIIIKTLLILLPKLKHYYRLCFPYHVDTLACFEVLGFDFILDSTLKPYLLEINYSPSFNRNTPVDRRVKDALLSDVFRLINLNKNEKFRIAESEKNLSKPKLWNQARENAKQKVRYEQTLKARVQWEEVHQGNFRKVYPCSEMSKYRKYLKKKQNQVFPKTFAPLITEEDYDMDKEKRAAKPREERKNPFINPTEETGKQEEVVEEAAKVDEKSKRELLLKSHSLIQDMYENLKQSGRRRMEMEIMMSRENCWDVENRHNEEYKKHKEKLTTGISAVLKTISIKPEIPLPIKERLSSIFLNPPALQNANKESHIGPMGLELEEQKENEESSSESGTVTMISEAEKMLPGDWTAKMFD